MRKRERERMAKKIKFIMDPLHKEGVGQLDGAYWYFMNNKEQKGVDRLAAAYTWVNYAQKQLKKLLKENGV